MKIVLILLLIGSIYTLYTRYFAGPKVLPAAGIPTGRYTLKAIPAYMNEGPVNLEKMIVKGKTNIIDFYSEYCPPCKKMAPFLSALDEKRGDIRVIKIDINRKGISGIDWQGPIAAQFDLKKVPYFLVVSPWGKLVCEGDEAYKYVIREMKNTGLARLY